ncbi:MAG: hypothetical protein IJ899_03105 [Blautia sp.]|nr:hypothetical protein [Blautia sp.]
MNTNEVLRENWQEIRQKLGNLISWIDGQIDSLDAKEKRLEKLENESYIRGLNDMKEACLIFTAIDGGMSSSDIREYFEIEKGTPIDVDKIIEKSEAADFVECINKWKKDQEAEKMKADDIQVGDEITYDYFNGVKQVSGKGIVTSIESERIGTPVYVINKGVNSDTFHNFWINKNEDDVKKTGRHFDSIPFDYDGRFDE